MVEGSLNRASTPLSDALCGPTARGIEYAATSITPSKAAQTRKEVFECSAGHTSKAGQKQVLVAVKRRSVTYNILATNRQGLTDFTTARGYETVEERPYCLEHAPAVLPEVVGSVTKHYKFLSTNPHRFKGDAYS